jgi:hypothetical protein
MYGTKEGIERLIGDIVSGRKFSTSTTPSISQVEAELTNVAAEIDNALDAMDYVVPVDVTTDPHAYAFLKAANEYGAAGRLLATIPTEAYDPGEQMADIGNTRAQMYERHLKNALKLIWELKLRATMVHSRMSKLRSSAPDAIYKRGMLEMSGQNGEESEEEEE